MVVKVIGLIELNDLEAFEIYRSQVGATVHQFHGQVALRGDISTIFWNELNADQFSSYVELTFPSLLDAQNWAQSPAYLDLINIRNQALKVTLFSVQTVD
jgi:uncharacterized protein (DUF1330 family)